MSKAFDINNFQIGKHLIIEASAGTGKTYNIVNIVKKLIDNGINLNEILIVTFTEKAAEELKNRIREKVSGADIDNASIGTIHSFCQNTIKKYCISSNLPSDIAVIEESDCDSLIKAYIRKPEPLAFITALKSILNYPCDGVLFNYINGILENYYMDSNFEEDPSIVSLDPAAVGSYQVFDNWLNGRDLRNGKNNRLVKELNVLKNSGNPDLLKIHSAIETSQTLKYRKPSNFDLTALSVDQKIALSFIDNIKTAIVGSSSSTENTRKKAFNLIVRSAAIEYSRDFYKLWTETKRNNAQQTYNDMIRNVREEIINKRPLLDCLKNEYRYAIIDEFQDTNQKQWDIFSNIFLTEGHNIIVVGDACQSIYSFQGSDLNVFNRAKQEIINAGGDVASLNTNYRASEGIVESANEFFKSEKALPKSMGFGPSKVGKGYFFKYAGKTDVPSYWIHVLKSLNEQNEQNEQ